MVSMKGYDVTVTPLGEVAGKLKYVNPESDIVKQAKGLGISFGD